MKKTIIAALVLATPFAFAAPKPGGQEGQGQQAKKGQVDPAKRAEMIMKKLDTDQSGDISFDEFKKGPMAQKAKDPSMLEKRFKMMDKDGSGAIDKKELAAMGGKRPQGKGKPGEKKVPAGS